jgi:hypothetical protein
MTKRVIEAPRSAWIGISVAIGTYRCIPLISCCMRIRIVRQPGRRMRRNNTVAVLTIKCAAPRKGTVTYLTVRKSRSCSRRSLGPRSMNSGCAPTRQMRTAPCSVAERVIEAARSAWIVISMAIGTNSRIPLISCCMRVRIARQPGKRMGCDYAVAVLTIKRAAPCKRPVTYLTVLESRSCSRRSLGHRSVNSG